MRGERKGRGGGTFKDGRHESRKRANFCRYTTYKTRYFHLSYVYSGVTSNVSRGATACTTSTTSSPDQTSAAHPKDEKKKIDNGNISAGAFLDRLST